MARIELGQYIVVDDEICHGQATFKGTRIMVWQVIEMVEEGRDWDTIVHAWRDKFPKEAIAEALDFTRKVFAEYSHEYAAKELPIVSSTEAMTRRAFGQYIVVDDEICHGQATFTGTRIMVWQIVRMVSRGIAWDRIVTDWDGRVTKEAIVEALRFAGNVLRANSGKYMVEHTPAA